MMKRIEETRSSRTEDFMRTVDKAVNVILNSGLDVEKIYLFGSYAYGEPNEESDIDVLAIFREDATDWRERFQRKLDLSARIRNTAVNRGLRYSVDLILWSEQEKEEQESRSSDFWREVQEYGRRLA